jgi:hypothetical protein
LNASDGGVRREVGLRRIQPPEQRFDAPYLPTPASCAVKAIAMREICA